jgi:hypothetical protein
MEPFGRYYFNLHPNIYTHMRKKERGNLSKFQKVFFAKSEFIIFNSLSLLIYDKSLFKMKLIGNN